MTKFYGKSLRGSQVLKVNNRNNRERWGICSKLATKTQERCYWTYYGVFIANFEHVSHFFLVFLLLSLNNLMFAGNPLVFIPYSWQKRDKTTPRCFFQNTFKTITPIISGFCLSSFHTNGFTTPKSPLLKWKPFKNDEKCFLFHLKNSLHSLDIQIFLLTILVI